MPESIPKINTILEMEAISKSFPGVLALDRVSFSCLRGEVHALVGENGAGKSTLMKILAGAYQPDSGKIALRGHEVHFQTPLTAQHQGVSIIYQEFNLLSYLSVAENIILGHEPRQRFGLLNIEERNRLARQALAILDVDIDPNLPVYRLSVAHQQLVEIARALSRDAELIIMDEPTAALSGSEVNRLFEVIASLKDQGITIIYVSHRMEEIFHIADRVTVLKDGTNMGTLPVAQTDEAQIIRMMVGRDLAQMYPPKDHRGSGDVVLEARKLSVGSQVQDVSLKLCKGEILGVAGLVGSGRTALARALFGAEPITKGSLLLDGQPFHPANPAEAVKAGFGFVTDDRKAEGLVIGLSVRENVSLPSIDERQRLGFVTRKVEQAVVARAVSELQVQTVNLERPVGYLSGGNQQKVVLGKWLAVQSTPEQLFGPDIILFDEPTRGIDVGAKSEIYALMRRLTDQGKAILMFSSELPEIMGMSDHILVMRDGRVAGEMLADEASQEKILTLAAGIEGTSRRDQAALQPQTPQSRIGSFTLGLKLKARLGENQGIAMVYAVLAALLIFGIFASTSFREPTNLFSILRQAVALGLVSIGQTIIILAGGIDLSVSSIITLAALFGAGLIDGRADLVLPVILLCLGLGVLFGLVNSAIWAYLGVEPFIVTLGTYSIGRGIALVYARGPVGSVPPGYQAFAYMDLGPIPLAVIFLAFTFVFFQVFLTRTSVGRHIYAAGGNPEATRLAGINLRRIRILAFTLSGLMAAVTGLYMASRMGAGDPNIGPGFELDSITAVIVGGTVLGGGRGSLLGTLGGVLLIATLSNLLNLMNVDNWYQQVIKGIILLAAVVLYSKWMKR